MDINRKTAYLTLIDVESRKAYSNLALNHQIIINKPSSQAFVREIVYGVLEHKLTIDYYLDQLVRNGIENLKAAELTILRMGVYQLRYMNSVPEYAAVNESVVLAKKYCRGKAGFINGVLREYLNRKMQLRLPDRGEDEVRYLSVKYSYSPWIIELWLEHYDMEFVERLLEAGNETAPLTVRLNWLKVMKKDLIDSLQKKGFEVSEGNLCQNALNVKGTGLLDSEMYKLGMFTPQDESSMLVAEKLDLIDKDARRLGILNIETRSWDATRVDSSMVQKADRVLVDAPCSGLGVIRRKPEIKYKEYNDDMELLPKKQLAILSASSAYVKPGGVLLYSTCTINPRENEQVVDTFLRKNLSFRQVERKLLLPDVDKTDGFFICLMKKDENLI